MKALSQIKYLLHSINFFILLCLLLNSCGSDQEQQRLELIDNQIAWFNEGQPTFPKEVRCSWISKDDKERISITGFTGSEGIMLLIYPEYSNIKGEYKMEGENSIMLNKKEGGQLAVFLSGACKPVTGKVVITEHDKINNTVSGYFEGNLCPKGKFILHKNTSIRGGAFKKVKYLK